MDLVLSSAKIRYEFVKKTISDTKNETNIVLVSQKNATNIFLISQKIQRKTGSAQQKMHRACFIPFADTHS